MPRQLDASEMRGVAEAINQTLDGLGFCLITFEFHKSGMSNYISNAEREDMIKALEETVDRLKKGKNFMTPNNN